MAFDSRHFVILEHRWNGVHWDFLVEDGDSLRTWAIDELIVEGVELPARALPPHRRVYLEYEGEITGGRGTVRRWEEGTCEVLEWSENLVRLDLRGAQLEGLAEFRCLEDEAEDEEGRRWLFRFGKLS